MMAKVPSDLSGFKSKGMDLMARAQELCTRAAGPATAAATGRLGVDIGTYAVKVVRCDVNKDWMKLLGFGAERIIDKNVREALSRSLAKAKTTPDQTAAISVSGQGVVSRYVEMPLMSRSDLESAMKFEIEKYVPFAIAEVTVDHAVVCEMKDKAKMSVLIAAAKNELVAKKCDLAREANLGLRAIDLDCLALANFFSEVGLGGKKSGCAAIVNIGRSVTNMDVLVDAVPHLSRDIFVGGDDVTRKMVEVLEIDILDAEKLKMDPGSRLHELVRVWDQVLNNLAAEIRVSLDYFEARMNRSVEKLWITGGGSRLQGIEEYLHNLLGVDVARLDYSDRILCDEGVDRKEFKAQADLLSIAFGLALR